MRHGDRRRACRCVSLLERRFLGRSIRFGNPLRPVVAEPQRREEMQVRRIRSPVDRRDAHEDVFGSALGVLHEDIEIAAVVEDAGVEELVLHLVSGTPAIRVYQIGIRKGRLRILVEVLHVRVRRRAVEIEVVLLHVLAVIALAVGQPEEPLLENGIFRVPEGEAEAQELLVIGYAGDAILAPAIGAGAGLIVRKEVPGVAVGAVVLAHGAPLAFAEVRSPLLPGRLIGARGFQPALFGIHGELLSCGELLFRLRRYPCHTVVAAKGQPARSLGKASVSHNIR